MFIPEFLQYDFMVRALVAGICVSIMTPLIGTFLVVRRYSLIVDTLSHVSLLGIAIGLLLGVNPYFTSVAIAVLAALLIEKIRGNARLYEESLLAIFLSGSLAISVVIISVGNGFKVNLSSLLFGSINTVTMLDVSLLALLLCVTALIVYKIYPKMFLVAFDQDLALASGVKVAKYNYLLLLLTALMVALSVRIVGVLLVSALIVLPVSTALQFRLGFKSTMQLAVLCSFLTTIIGLIGSFYLEWPSGGAIVVLALIGFIFSVLLQKFK